MEGLIYFVLVIGLYFLPAIIAIHRKHSNTNTISMVNLFLGWTFLGWVVALAWAFSDNTKLLKAENKKKKEDINEKSKIEELEKLGNLKEKGLLTDEEFQNEKNKILKKDN